MQNLFPNSSVGKHFTNLNSINISDNLFSHLSFAFLIIFFVSLISFPAFAILSEAKIPIFAVTENNTGLAAELILRTSPGTGRIAFITSNSLVGKDTQITGNTAIKIASAKTKIDVSKTDFIFDIQANASEVDGPSAGAAMSLLAYSVLSEKIIPQNVGLTGTINSDGTVGVVGGVFPKSKAAKSIGIQLFMIPKGEAEQIIKENGSILSVNMLSYGPEKLGIKIIEVRNLDDVIKYAFSDISSIVVDTTMAPDFVPPAINYVSELSAMKFISQNYISRAKKIVEDAKAELNKSSMSEDYKADLYPLISQSTKDIETAQIYLDQNYLYSAANNAFNARVLSDAIFECAKNPSLLIGNSVVLNQKVDSLEAEIVLIKKQSSFIALDKMEWLIGAHQRMAYALNALRNIRISNTFEVSSGNEIDAVAFKKVYDYASAKAWYSVAGDFIGEANKSTQKKKLIYNSTFVDSILKKIESVSSEVNDFNSGLSAGDLTEANRRLSAAKINSETNFVYASGFDIGFAESTLELSKEQNEIDILDLNVLKSTLESEFNSTNFTSLWANLYYGHALFYFKNATQNTDAFSETEQLSFLLTSNGLLSISKKIELAKKVVDEALLGLTFEDYVYVPKDFNSINSNDANDLNGANNGTNNSTNGTSNGTNSDVNTNSNGTNSNGTNSNSNANNLTTQIIITPLGLNEVQVLVNGAIIFFGGLVIVLILVIVIKNKQNSFNKKSISLRNKFAQVNKLFESGKINLKEYNSQKKLIDSEKSLNQKAFVAGVQKKALIEETHSKIRALSRTIIEIKNAKRNGILSESDSSKEISKQLKELSKQKIKLQKLETEIRVTK